MISPLDDRYEKEVGPLSEFFSESAFLKYQVEIEQRYLESLIHELRLPFKFSKLKITDNDIELIKQIETKGYKDIPATNHDLKAVEYFLKLKLPKGAKEWIHFGLTSEDVKNLAHGLQLKGALEKIIVSRADELTLTLAKFAKNTEKIVMLARTHGQAASPTTFGREIMVFVKRLEGQLDLIKQLKIDGKLNGSVGTYFTLKFAYPKIDWPSFSQRFVESLGLTHVSITTQIVPPDSYLRIFQAIKLFNSILIDFCQDMWRYISDSWVKQKTVEGEVGSSVMPQKVNPIHFESAEGNLKIANGMFDVFIRELPISRLQRDLSDSTIKRNFGVALAHSLLAYNYCFKGLLRVEPNEKLMKDILEAHPEVLAEAYQTELRKYGLPGYELLKGLTRGKKVTLEDMHAFVDKLDLPETVKEKLKGLTFHVI